jgi:hypothetical protein
MYRLLMAYRYMAFDLPQLTTTLGVLSLLGTAAVHLYLLGATASLPAYLAAYFAALALVCIASAAMMVLGRFARRGWLLGSLVSVVFLVVYILTRFTGLPEAPGVKGWWDFPSGTTAIGCAVLFVAVHASVLLGINVAHPQKRDWHD